MERSRPSGQVLEALKGTISRPIETVSHKLGSHQNRGVTVNIVLAGPGLIGLEDASDNREWAGINNHQWLTARYGVYFSRLMVEAGYDTNPNRILNAMLVSHTGRRQWDEADWYPKAVSDAETKRNISNETLGLRLIQGKVPQGIFDLVAALGHNVEGFSVDRSIYTSWDYRIAIYVDHRTAQGWESLHTSLGEFLLANFFDGHQVTPGLRAEVYAQLKELIDRQKLFLLGKEKAEEITIDEADQIAQQLGASADSARLTRRKLMRLILQDADTEATLIGAGIDTENINDKIVPMPRWERYLRRLFVNDAEKEIFNVYRVAVGLNELLATLEEVGPKNDQVERNFPANTWWGSYVRALFEYQNGNPYRSKRDNSGGIDRAIEFFGRLDEVRAAK